MAVEKTINPMDEKEVVFIPKVSGEDENVWVGLNGKSWSIPRGKKTEVPRPVAEILYQSERAKEEQEKYIKQQQELLNDTLKNPIK